MSVNVCFGTRSVRLPSNTTLSELAEGETTITFPFHVPSDVLDLLESNNLDHAALDQVVQLAMVADYLEHEPSMAAVTEYFKSRTDFRYSELCRAYWYSDVTVSEELEKFANHDDHDGLDLHKFSSNGDDAGMTEHSKDVDHMLLLPDGKLATSLRSLWNYEVRVWDLRARACVAIFQGHTNMIRFLISLSDRLIASGSADGTVRVWDAVDNRYIATMPNGRDVLCACTTHSNMLAAGLSSGVITVWELEHYTHVADLTGHANAVFDLIALKDGRLASASKDGSVRVWHLGTCWCDAVLTSHESLSPNLFQLDDTRLAVFTTHGGCGVVQVWNLKDGALLSRVGGLKLCRGSTVIGTTNLIVCIHKYDQKSVFVIDLNTCERVASFRFDSCIFRVTSLSNRHIMCVSTNDNSYIWDLQTGELLDFKKLSWDDSWVSLYKCCIVLSSTDVIIAPFEGYVKILSLQVKKIDRLRVLTAAGCPCWCTWRILSLPYITVSHASRSLVTS